MKARQAGDMIQIDHMGVSRGGGALKEFRAVCPIGKQLVARVHSRATAHNARRFLQAVLEDLPYPPRSIQVDGGSEFRAGFEDACQALNLPLAVLPPKCPQLNGVVERANDSARTEFWSLHQGRNDRQGRRARPGRIPALPQPCPTPLRAGLAHPDGIPSPAKDNRTRKVPYVLNPHTGLIFL